MKRRKIVFSAALCLAVFWMYATFQSCSVLILPKAEKAGEDSLGSEILPQAEIGGAITDNGDGTLTVEFEMNANGADAPRSASLSRSLTGASDDNIAEKGLRNYYQLIAIEKPDSGLPTKIWDFDEDGGATASGKLRLNMTVKSGKTYYIMLLGGYENDWIGTSDTTHTKDPVLLTAGFSAQPITRTSNILIPMYRLVSSLQFQRRANPGTIVDGSSGPPTVPKTGTPGSGGLKTGEPDPSLIEAKMGPGNELTITGGADSVWDAVFSIGTTADDNKAVTGDGLYGLKLAEEALKGGAGEFYGAGSVTVQAGSVVFYDADGTDALNWTTSDVRHTISSTVSNTGDIAVPIPQIANTAGAVGYRLQYTPFGKDTAFWAGSDNDLFQTPDQATAPVWYIQNGLTMVKQDGTTDFIGPGSATSQGLVPLNIKSGNFNIYVDVNDGEAKNATRKAYASLNGAWEYTVSSVEDTPPDPTAPKNTAVADETERVTIMLTDDPMTKALSAATVYVTSIKWGSTEAGAEDISPVNDGSATYWYQTFQGGNDTGNPDHQGGLEDNLMGTNEIRLNKMPPNHVWIRIEIQPTVLDEDQMKLGGADATTGEWDTEDELTGIKLYDEANYQDILPSPYYYKTYNATASHTMMPQMLPHCMI
ncbi:MAG: hypothetical protein LBM77_12020 [Spirochaetaceae bacterium]|nr:hypothetical protein [Spirochaetaceae bacterium]